MAEEPECTRQKHLCRIEQPTVYHDLTIRWKWERWLIAGSPDLSPLADDKVDVFLTLDGTLGLPAVQPSADVPVTTTSTTSCQAATTKRKAGSDWMRKFQLKDSLPLGELYRRG